MKMEHYSGHTLGGDVIAGCEHVAGVCVSVRFPQPQSDHKPRHTPANAIRDDRMNDREPTDTRGVLHSIDDHFELFE